MPDSPAPQAVANFDIGGKIAVRGTACAMTHFPAARYAFNRNLGAILAVGLRIDADLSDRLHAAAGVVRPIRARVSRLIRE